MVSTSNPAYYPSAQVLRSYGARQQMAKRAQRRCSRFATVLRNEAALTTTQPEARTGTDGAGQVFGATVQLWEAAAGRQAQERRAPWQTARREARIG